MSKTASALKARLDELADDDALGFTPDAVATAEVLIRYHGDDAERVLSEAADLVKKWKAQ